MASEIGMEFVDLNDFQLDPEAVKLVPESIARRHRVLAIGFRGDTPIIGMANPSDVFAVDDLRTLIGRDIHTVVCSVGQITEYLARVYRHDQETMNAAQTAASQTSAFDTTLPAPARATASLPSATRQSRRACACGTSPRRSSSRRCIGDWRTTQWAG
jgi:hypothetical protein